AGTWFMDPRDLIIDNTDSHVNGASPFAPNGTSTGPSHLNVSHLTTSLNGGTNVVVTTVGSPSVSGGGDGTITIASSIQKTAGTLATLTLNAAGSIIQNVGTVISSTVDKLNLVFNAGHDITLNGTTNTNGGNVTLTAGTGSGD